MTESDTCYCRLCAEPTEKDSLISPEEDVAVTSKIVSKMLWINIDISTSGTLPKTICFSCFDLLERTYRFLQTVRTAQAKLQGIYKSQSDDVPKIDLSENVAKPVDKDFETFQETKPQLKIENDAKEYQETAEDTTNLLECMAAEIKDERSSFDDLNNDYNDNNSSGNDDEPLLSIVKRKKTKNINLKDANLVAQDITSSISYPLVTWEDYTWRCGNCDALFLNPQSLRIHSIQIHSTCCVFKCNDCSRNFTNFKIFIKHVREHKKLLRYCCEICNKRFVRVSLLKKHYNTHKAELYMMCEYCGISFENAELLSDHIILYSKCYKQRNRDRNSNLKCDICDKEFKSRGNLQQHKQLHTERSRNFSCHKCGKMFFTKGTLGTHMMTHEEVKPYKCEHCSLTFRARGNLQSHLSLHSNAKPFVCEQCGKSFRVKRLLKSHYIVHTDLMPYVCEYCNKAFRFKTRLNLHIRQHTGAKPYTCLYCQRDFTNGSNYKKHMKRRHNVDTSRKKYVNLVEESNNDVILEAT